MENNQVTIYEAPRTEISAYRNNYNVTIGNDKFVLKRGTDFGMIKRKDGTAISQRPTLFKSGAHRILTAFGLSYTTELVDKYADYEKGFFYFVFKATAYYNGQPVRTGYGCANTNEKSSGFANGFDMANTKMKLAEKRAEVDLAIKLADASGWFTQDLEDTELEKQATKIISDADPITSKQQARIFAIAGTYNISKEKAKELLLSWGFASTKDITQGQYDGVCAKLEAYGKAKG